MVSVFLILGAVGVGLLLVSILIGDLLDGVLDFGDVGGDFFSLAGLAGFLGALGFTGAIMLSLVENLLLAIVVGVIVGLGVGALAAWLTMRLKDPTRDSDSTVRSQHLIGAVGRVVHPIPVSGFGQVRVSVHGHPTMLNAKADEPIAAGRLIQVTAVLSPTSVRVRAGEPIEP
ncbi:NfeD family protein [Granulicoccus sp. GXG6511]|uniref:NfeD family protein n=1 Tax=Granulicoccus sp. GXG6511 TaxID=3381351 RepID=UPI003D7D2BA1